MRRSVVRLLADRYSDAGPLTGVLADTGRICSGVSTELANFLETAPSSWREELGALWAHVERTGPDDLIRLREIDAARRTRAETLNRQMDEVA